MGGNYIALIAWILTTCPHAYAYLDISVEPEEKTYTEESKPPGFMNRTEILELVTQDKYDVDSAVQTFIATYKFNKLDSCRKYFPTGIKRSTFIVIEGQQRTKRFGLAKRLARVLKGHLVYNPPKGYAPFRNALHESQMVTAFYSLCLYITAQTAKRHVVKHPAVVAGYYIGQKAFSIAKNNFPRLPSLYSGEWDWPGDLLVPDLVFNLMTPIDDDTDLETKVFVNYTQAIINAWPSPRVIPVYNVSSYEDMIDEILPRLFTVTE